MSSTRYARASMGWLLVFCLGLLLGGCGSSSRPADEIVSARRAPAPSATQEAGAESGRPEVSPTAAATQRVEPRATASPAGPRSSPTPQDPTPLPTYPPEDDDRDSYADRNIAGDARWQQHYEEAVARQEPWLRNPVEVARQWLGPGEAGGPPCTRGSFATLSSAADQTILIAILCAGDDTIQALKLRFELSQHDGRWKIDWIGSVVKCGRPPPATPSPWKNMPCP